jgi:hypothetical protein
MGIGTKETDTSLRTTIDILAAINPESSEETQRDRAQRLAKKIRRYGDIARAAAKLCKREADFFIPQLVEGTSYALLSHE